MYVKDKESFVYVSKNSPHAIPLVQQMNHSNGISAYIDKSKLPSKFKTKIEKAGKISINPDQPLSYYQSTEFIGNSVIIIDTSKLTKNQALYVVSEIQRIRKGSTWNDKFPKEQVKIAKIQLPTKNGKIDFDFMESFIAEIEENRIAKLKTYLLNNNLYDYNLTDNEQQAFNDFVQENFKSGEFKISELFKIHNTLSFNTEKLVSGDEYDYITRTSQNQGILQQTGFVNTENINLAGNWSLGLLQMDFFYRHKPWYAGQFVRKITPKINVNRSEVLYLTVILNKLKQKLLTVLVRDVDKTFLNSKVKLPILDNNQINYAFINNLISAIEKLVIKDVVLYVDKKTDILAG
jgi:hypothetical protein